MSFLRVNLRNSFCASQLTVPNVYARNTMQGYSVSRSNFTVLSLFVRFDLLPKPKRIFLGPSSLLLDLVSFPLVCIGPIVRAANKKNLINRKSDRTSSELRSNTINHLFRYLNGVVGCDRFFFAEDEWKGFSFLCIWVWIEKLFN